MRLRTRFLLLLTCLLPFGALAQLPPVPGAPISLENAPQRDTTRRGNQPTWQDEPVTIWSRKAASEHRDYPDTGLHTFHRRPFAQPWIWNLGNLGTPARSFLFTPDNYNRTGPSLGYHTFDVYRLDADSLSYYNTTRPYTDFTYQLGTRLEQVLNVLHTQNIRPSWNFAAVYRKINSQGYYRNQRTNHDNGGFTTSYQGPGQHYQLFAAFVYNKEQQDENGGIVSDTFLNQSRYSDRRTVPVAFDNQFYSTVRSPVTNTLRDYNVLLQHSYTWGRTDTLYNADSTQYWLQLTPRFRISHRLETGAQKYIFKYLQADSALLTSFFRASLDVNDSVYSRQRWAWVNNRVTLDGFLGKRERQLRFSAGIGNRVDRFSTDYITGEAQNSILSNYLTGELRKEALAPGQWNYTAAAQLFLTGASAGNFLLHASIGKDLGPRWGAFSAGFRQQLSSAPYNYTYFRNRYVSVRADLGNESITELYGTLSSERLGLQGGVRNMVLANYIYLADSFGRVTNRRLEVKQESGAFNLTQIWLRKVFHFGLWVLDNELAFQQVAGNAPVAVPALVGRHQISYEALLFRKALRVATGIDVRYHTPFHSPGYAPFYNRFYYQDTYTSGADAEAAAFFNFKVKRFRAYLMADQLQTLLGNYNTPIPGYPSQELMIRFGFSWILVN